MKTFLILFLFIFNSYAAEVTLYAIKSPKVLDWTTPRSLLMSTLKSYARVGAHHKIGHAYLGFKCDGQREILSGMTSGPGFGAKQSLFQDKVGMSVILIDNPGHFQDHNESLNDIENFSDTYRINSLSVEITNEQCLKMQEWHQTFSSQDKFIYGGVDKRPLKGEGAGCSAYAMSFFEVADIDFAFFNQEFLRTIFIPQNLLGGDIGKGKDVKIKTILKERTLLNREDSGDLKVELYDPNDMFFWIQDEWLRAQRNEKSTRLSNYSIEIDLVKKMKILKIKKRENQ